MPICDPDYKGKSHVELGEVYFWTATINNWYHLLEEDRYKNIIVDSLATLSKRKLVDVFVLSLCPIMFILSGESIHLMEEKPPMDPF